MIYFVVGPILCSFRLEMFLRIRFHIRQIQTMWFLVNM